MHRSEKALQFKVEPPSRTRHPSQSLREVRVGVRRTALVLPEECDEEGQTMIGSPGLSVSIAVAVSMPVADSDSE